MFDSNLFKAALQARLLKETLSLRDAAKQTGISVSTLSRLTTGKMQPDMETFSALVKWLGADANSFLAIVPGEIPRDDWMVLVYTLSTLGVPHLMQEAIVTIVRHVIREQERKSA